ncbi:MAG: sulfatase-like hydrolase/transferase [Planctomycetota bacterium]|jgi:arylsulfatase A-like enzyme/Tfp pilus assembly protein PilF
MIKPNHKPKLQNRCFRAAIYFLLLLILVLVVWLLFELELFAQKPHNVILISIDTCRADYLGCYGYPRETTPNIDMVAREAVLFNHALTPVPLTLPGHASMLTGTIPPYHGVHYNIGYRLEESNLTTAEILQKNSYTTGAIISSFVLDAQFGLAQGFDSYNDRFVEPIESVYRSERRADEVSRFACSWLESHRDEPFFLFVHYYDPHSPYLPPEPFALQFADNPYAGEIAYTDYYIGQVIKKLKDLNLYESTLLIITSDHGESLFEHSEKEHGYFIYQSTVHVPLIIRVPGGPKGKTVNEAVGLIDIAPTICSMLGITPPSTVQGTDLSCFLGKKGKDTKSERYIYCESLLPTQYGCSPLFGVVNDRWKYVQAPIPELYDLNNDPDEKANLADKDPKRCRFLENHLKLVLEDYLRRDRSEDEFVLDQESRRRLESLGYVAGVGLSEVLEFDSAREDPKDSIRLHEQIMLIRTYLKNKQFNKAEAVCSQIIAERPEHILNSFLLGQVAMGENNISRAIAHFSQFLSQADAEGGYSKDESLHFLRMYIGKAHNNMGRAFAKQKSFDSAIGHYKKALEINPDFANAYYNLGNVFLRRGELDEAIKHYTKALDLAPDLPEAHLNMGNALLKQGKLEEAIAYYNKAIKVRPDYREALQNLQQAQLLKEKREKE